MSLSKRHILITIFLFCMMACTPQQKESFQQKFDEIADKGDETLVGTKSLWDAMQPFVPPPFNTIGGLIVGAWACLASARARQNRKAAKSIAGSVKKSVENGALAMTDGAKSIMNAVQTPSAKRIVDEVQGKTNVSMPL